MKQEKNEITLKVIGEPDENGFRPVQNIFTGEVINMLMFNAEQSKRLLEIVDQVEAQRIPVKKKKNFLQKLFS